MERLLSELIISQSEDDSVVASVLSKVNDKIAIHVFSNLLNNNELRTIIKTKNYP